MTTVFLDNDKERRAKHIYQLIIGKKSPASEGDSYNKIRLDELLKEKKVDIKDEAKSVHAIYILLGGAVSTHEEVVARKVRAKKARKMESEESDGKDADDEEEDEDEDE